MSRPARPLFHPHLSLCTPAPPTQHTDVNLEHVAVAGIPLVWFSGFIQPPPFPPPPPPPNPLSVSLVLRFPPPAGPQKANLNRYECFPPQHMNLSLENVAGMPVVYPPPVP